MIVRSPAARAAWIAFAAALPVYAATMGHTVGLGDSGELAAAAATFGVPHPTGYPTLMLVAGALTHLVPLRPILVLNAFAGLLTAASAAVLTLLLDRVLAAARATSLATPTRAAYASLAGLFMAFTMTWWQQTNAFEVYALHALFMPLVVLLFLRWSEAAAQDPPEAPSLGTRRAGWAFAAVLGLSFTNHMTTVLLAPGLLIAAGMRFGFGRALCQRILPLVPAFGVGLLPYAWLPICSSLGPRFDWGATKTLPGFLEHITGAQYHQFLFTDLSRMALQNRYLMWRVPLEFSAVGLLVAGLGAMLLVRRAPAHAALAFGFITAGWLFATGYGIPDLDAYLLTTLLGTAVLFAAGLLRVHERFGARIAVPIAAAMVLVNLVGHWRECDARGDRLADGFVRDLVGPLPQGAVLFTSMWENLESAFYYFQEVEGFRPDVVVISPTLARLSWYLDELERREPRLVARAGASFGAYRSALQSLERGRTIAWAEVESARRIFLDALAAGCMSDRPVFSTGAFSEGRPTWRRVPWHLVLWLRSDSTYVPEGAWRPRFRPWRGRMDMYAAQTCQAYAEARLERARYETRHGRSDRAEQLVREATAFDPHIRPERVGPLPLGFDRFVLMSARFFRELRAMDQVSALR